MRKAPYQGPNSCLSRKIMHIPAAKCSAAEQALAIRNRGPLSLKPDPQTIVPPVKEKWQGRNGSDFTSQVTWSVGAWRACSRWLRLPPPRYFPLPPKKNLPVHKRSRTRTVIASLPAGSSLVVWTRRKIQQGKMQTMTKLDSSVTTNPKARANPMKHPIGKEIAFSHFLRYNIQLHLAVDYHEISHLEAATRSKGSSSSLAPCPQLCPVKVPNLLRVELEEYREPSQGGKRGAASASADPFKNVVRWRCKTDPETGQVLK
eukprot:284815051_1